LNSKLGNSASPLMRESGLRQSVSAKLPNSGAPRPAVCSCGGTPLQHSAGHGHRICSSRRNAGRPQRAKARLHGSCQEQQRPAHIYDAEFDCHRGTARYGSRNPESLGTIMPGDGTSKERVPPLRTNLEVSGAVVRFTDAAGITWLRRPDGELFEQRQQ
jgi:hypothetical protein